ncbi:MAG: mevalonate kinase [Anaerolineales bacterium]|nr:mevalonate kinase [Anaerolineales bacterium]
MTQASAPGKIILFGEHAVVYGRPAIAVPLPSIRATVEVDASPPTEQDGILVQAPALSKTFMLEEISPQDPLGFAIRLTLETLQITRPPNLRIKIESEIPISAGLGSGAAVTVAIIRSLCRHFGRTLSDEKISELAYEVERLYHGTPSGVDNSVVTFEKPIYFRRGHPVERFSIAERFTLVLAHSGESTPTAEVVHSVRDAWQANRADYERKFDAIGRIVDLAYGALKRGDVALLGPLMDQNQMHLEALGVSCHALDTLIKRARAAGAAGAKLSGGGRGGFMLALVGDDQIEDVTATLQAEGASPVLHTTIR